MAKSIVVKESLEQLLVANWTSILDRITLMRRVLEDARDGDYKVLEQADIPPSQTRVTVTRFSKISKTQFEVWVEFTAPKGDGVVQGSHIYNCDLEDLVLQQTFGVHFVTKNTTAAK